MAALMVVWGVFSPVAIHILIVITVCSIRIMGVLSRTLVVAVMQSFVHHAICQSCKDAEGEQDMQGGFHLRDP